MEEATIWLILFSIFLLLLLLLSNKFTQHKHAKHTNLPPSPPCLPLIGHLLLLKEPLHRTFHNLTQKYGQIVFLQLGTRKVLVISSPSAIEECLAKNDINFANRPITLAGKYLNYDHKTMGFASYGDHWRNLRRLTTLELLSSNRIAMFRRVREDEVQLMVKQLFDECKEGQKSMVETRGIFVELAFNIMLRMISGKRYYGKSAVAKEGKEFQILMKEFSELQGSGNLNDFFPILQWFDFKGMEKKMVKLMKKMDGFLQKLIDEHDRNGRSDQKNMTLIDAMLDLQQKESEFYTFETVKGVILAMLVAGSETTSTTLEWALSLLLNNPETMKKLRVEIDTCVGHDHLLNESDSTNKLKYLTNVITETLRLYPVAPLLLPHESSTDCKVYGYDIPRGTMLFVNLWTLHRDPKLWENPTKFVPERFEEGAGEGGGEVLYNMIPFGVGRRACPGTVLAKRVMGHALGALIQCFEWERIGNEEMDMAEGVGLTIPKVEPLIAFCKPRQEMIKVMNN